MNLKEPEITELILRQLQGKSSAAEDEILAKWLAENSSNSGIMEEYRNVWLKSEEKQELIFQPDINAAWSKVAAKANIHDTPVRSISPEASSISNFMIWKVAAAFILMVGLGYFAFKNLIPQQQELIEVLSYADSKEILLPDGSEVTLDKNSSFKYPEEFNGNERKVYLKGQAFFSVKKDSLKPFRIEGHQSITEVLGTTFNLTIDGLSEHVSLFTGKVAFTSLKTHNSVILEPGQSASISVSGESVKDKNQSLNQNILAWKTGQLVFEDVPLKEVALELQKHFNGQIYIQHSIENNRFTGTFRHADLKQIMEVVSISTDTKLSSKDSVYSLTENSQP